MMLFAIEYNSHLDGFGAYLFVVAVGVIVFGVLLVAVLPALVVAGLARRGASKFIQDRQDTVTVQYDPPQCLSPAECGLLYDMRCSHTEVMATLFTLEERKVIRILDDKSVSILDRRAYDNLPEYEAIAVRLANGEMGWPRSERLVTLRPATATGEPITVAAPAPKSLFAFTSAVRASLLSKGITTRNYYSAFTLRAAIASLVLALLPMLSITQPGTLNDKEYAAFSVASLTSAIGFTFFMAFFLLPIYIGFGCILVFLWTRIVGRYWLNSKQARALWPELEGYRLYLKEVDLDNIQFESTQDTEDPVTKTFPYAMVFDLDAKWPERLRRRRQLTIDEYRELANKT